MKQGLFKQPNQLFAKYENAPFYANGNFYFLKTVGGDCKA
jgi:hypothetical protein